jgi:hypothetical protein
MFRLLPKKKPKPTNLRGWVARWLVALARWVEPKSPDTMAYLAEQVLKAEMDLMKYGRSCIKVEHVPYADT